MYQQGPPPEVAPLFAGIMCVVWLLVMAIAVAVTVVMVVAYWKICAKAGYPGALGLLMLVPVANIILPIYLGFTKWPIQEELERYRASGGGSDLPPALR